jgi:hypothetical protein
LTMKIEAIADGSGKTHLDACATNGGLVCTTVTGPFKASINDGEPAALTFVENYKETDGTPVGTFQGDLTGDAPESTIFVKRNTSDGPGSTVTMPEPAVITAPAEGATLSLATDEIRLMWEAKGSKDPLEWTSAVKCGEMTSGPATAGTPIEDTGDLLIQPSELNLKAGETCEVTLILRRWRDGTIEGAFTGNGLITAKQIRSVTFTLTP